MVDDLIIGGVSAKAGTRTRIHLNVARLYDLTDMTIPIEVIRGKKYGPRLFISAAIHGDEINGVEIVRRVLKHKSLKRIKGTLIVVPIVNVFGFNAKTRYLPDRRDLNRFFPGRKNGSLTGQMAHTFMSEIVDKCTHGIDLHTAAINRANLPQIRACLDDPVVERMAQIFRVPVILNAPMREGSLRHTAHMRGIPTLLFEGGEALRFNEKTIKSAVRGIISVMRDIEMLPRLKNKTTPHPTFIARSSHWVRAPHSGIFIARKALGDRVEQGQVLGYMTDPFGAQRYDVIARHTGIIIGITTLPLLNQGEAAVHIATFEDADAVQERVDAFEEKLDSGETSRFLD